jgi:cytochrome c biogenesis protein CcmG, thiol:disulfide interchange protein DsbE
MAVGLRRAGQVLAIAVVLALLAVLRGKAVVLNFWASWCIPCKEEAPRLEAAWQKWRSKVVVVGIDANDFKSDARRFARRYKITYPLVHDGPGDLLDDYGLAAFPETFFVRPDGRLSSWTQGELSEAEIEAGIREALAE